MPKTLLLADDSVVIQKLVGLSFANEDVELTTTDNGDDAVAKARELKPDLILADVVMPGKNGYEVCETIKADADLRHIPVLLLTGTFEAFDENRARTAGSDGHITKPFEAQALVDRVTDLLAQAPAQPPLATTAPKLDGPAVTRVAAATQDSDSFEFFDDGAQNLAEPAAAPAPPAPEPPAAAAPPPLPPVMPSPLEQPPAAAPPAAAGTLPPLPGSAPTDAAPDIMANDDALMPDSAAASTPPIDDLAFDADDLTPPLDAGATTVQLNDEPAPQAATKVDDDLLLGDAPSWSDDLDIGPEPIRGPAGDETQIADDLFRDPPSPAAAPVDLDAAPPAPAPAVGTPLDALQPPSHVMSDGDSSSDSIAFGDAAPSDAPDPMKTMLADDLFGDSPPPAPPAFPTEQPPADLDLDPPGMPAAPSEGVANEFDVSSSDLEHSIPDMPALDLSPPPVPEPAPAEPAPAQDDFSVSDGLLAGAPPQAPASEPAPEPAPVSMAPEAPAMEMPAAAQAEPAAPDLGPNLTPIMRDRVHETLERVAWEAFSDLSDTIVKQVVERVEQVAWEVIPQMAEAAIKEEIRRMKGDSDE